MKISGAISHPPLHQGCDCYIEGRAGDGEQKPDGNEPAFTPPVLKKIESDAIKEWIGVKDSSLSFDDFRTGNSEKAKALRKLTLLKGDPILKSPHFRGITLTDAQIFDLDTKKIMSLNKISSFSRTEKLADQWAGGVSRMAQSIGIKDARKVLIEVTEGLKHGIDIAPYAEALAGQKETLTGGSLKILKINKKQDGSVFISAKHVYEK